METLTPDQLAEPGEQITALAEAAWKRLFQAGVAHGDAYSRDQVIGEIEGVVRAALPALLDEVERLRELVEVAYEHLDRWGAVKGDPDEIASQERFFDLRRAALLAGSDGTETPTPCPHVALEFVPEYSWRCSSCGESLPDPCDE
jgi:hypothetical protein